MMEEISNSDRLLLGLKPGCTPRERLFGDLKGYYTSLDSFDKAFQALHNDKLVQSMKYSSYGANPRALSALTSKGAKHLVENKLCLLHEARTTLPDKDKTLHEMWVTEIVRTIIWERYCSAMPYDAEYYDDQQCKKNRNRLGLIGWVPDLLLVFKSFMRMLFRMMLAIEVDLGSRDVEYVIRTMLSRDCQTLFLCQDQERIETLRNEFIVYEEFHNKAFFAKLNNFCTKPGGVFCSDWIDLHGRTISLTPSTA